MRAESEAIDKEIADLADAYKIKPIFASVLPISDYHKDVNPRYEMTKVHPPATILELGSLAVSTGAGMVTTRTRRPISASTSWASRR